MLLLFKLFNIILNLIKIWVKRMRTKAISLLCFLLVSLCGCSQKSGVADIAIKEGVDESDRMSQTDNSDDSQVDDRDNQTSESEHVHRFLLTVAKQPDKTNYEEGTCFDGAGMILIFVCECGNYETAAEYEVAYETGGNAFAAQDSSVIIRSGNQEVKIPVTVKAYGGGMWSEPMPLN